MILKLLGTTGLCAGLLLAATATPVQADGLHLFLNDPKYLWHKGCEVSYEIAPDIPEPTAVSIAEALSAIGEHTAMRFTRVPSGGLIIYRTNPKLGSGIMGMGGTDGTVELAPAERVPDWGDARINADIRRNLIVHETMHVFGLAHDMDETDPNGPDEIMYPIISIKPLAFGAGDLAGLTAVREKNRCGTANEVKPGGANAEPPSIIKPTNIAAAKRLCMALNPKFWKWSVTLKKCVRRH